MSYYLILSARQVPLLEAAIEQATPILGRVWHPLEMNVDALEQALHDSADLPQTLPVHLLRQVSGTRLKPSPKP